GFRRSVAHHLVDDPDVHSPDASDVALGFHDLTSLSTLSLKPLRRLGKRKISFDKFFTFGFSGGLAPILLIAIFMPRSAQDIARLGTRFAYSIFCAMTECDNRGGLPTREDPPVILVL